LPPEPGAPAAQQVTLGNSAQVLVRAALGGDGESADGRISIRTGVFVMDPPFFGNGDIGRVAVCAVVNDVASSGAEPQGVSLGIVVEAGLPVRLLHRLTWSVREAAREAGVEITAVDTKVVRAGEADQVFVTATAYGIHRQAPLRLAGVRPGDRILVTRPLGDHAAHILAMRGAPGFERYVASDCAPLNGLLAAVLPQLRYARPVTAGGLAAVLESCASASGLTLRIEEAGIPVQHETRVALGMQGIDPLNATCAGNLCLFAPPETADSLLGALRAHPNGRLAAAVGEVTPTAWPAVEVIGSDGRTRTLGAPEVQEPARLL
jgi:hydrogenase expression/formation protein HypE